MAAEIAPHLLLLLACSGRKRHDAGTLPAVERYDGVNYHVLRKAQRERRVPHALDVLILSAEFGVLNAHDQVSDYDRLMTPARAHELQADVARILAMRMAEMQYDEVFVAVGKTYRIALETARSLQDHPHVTYAQGGIGEQMAELKRWLAAHSQPPQR